MKQIRMFTILKFLPVLLIPVILSSCKKDVSKTLPLQENSSTVNNSHNSETKKVYISNVDELYSAVNDPANENTTLVLAPGVYALSANYPNAGRLELQENMSLLGHPGHPESVIIDESNLPLASFLASPNRTGGIRVGKGSNNISWLTVKGGTVTANAFSVIDTDLPSTQTEIGIDHVVILGNGSNIGIDIRNRRADQIGRVINATLEQNDISGVITFLGPGIEIQNANGASGSFINVTLRGNYIHANKVGVGAFNNAATVSVLNSQIKVESYADHIEGNGVGMYVGGGLCQVANQQANSNSTNVEIHGSYITNNNPNPMPVELQPVLPAVTTSGIFAFGGQSSTNTASGNSLNILLQACHITGNNEKDILGFGATSSNANVLAGTYNATKIALNGVSKNAAVTSTASVPTEAAGTNTISVIK